MVDAGTWSWTGAACVCVAWPVQGVGAAHASEVRSVGPDHVFTSCLI